MLFSGIIKKTDLVEIEMVKPEIFDKVDALFSRFTQAVDKALIREGKLAEAFDWQKAEGGGAISDLFLKQHCYRDNLNVKDIDVFVQAPIDALNGFELDEVLKELDVEFEIKNREQEDDYGFMKIPFVIKFVIDGTPVEFILCRNLQRIFDFDLTFRQFYRYNDKFFATKLGLQDARDGIIRVCCPVTPISTLFRIFYMNQKYGFHIDEQSFRLVEYVFGCKNCSQEQVYNFLRMKQKDAANYSHDVYNDVYNAIKAVETYLNLKFCPVYVKEITRSTLNGFEPETNSEKFRTILSRSNLSDHSVLKMCAPKGYHHNSGDKIILEYIAPICPFRYQSIANKISNINSHDLNYEVTYTYGFFYKYATLVENADGLPNLELDKERYALANNFAIKYEYLWIPKKENETLCAASIESIQAPVVDNTQEVAEEMEILPLPPCSSMKSVSTGLDGVPDIF